MPASPMMLWQYGSMAVWQYGSMAVWQTARRLKPVIPASYSEILGEIRFSQGNYKAALVEFERALQINPAHMRARMWLVTALVQLEALDEAGRLA